MKILVINGPNLQLLGKRRPEVYGTATLADLEKQLLTAAQSRGVELEFFQSNHEGDIVDRVGSILQNAEPIDGIIINPAAYTHTSVAIRDALEAVEKPTIEVHISNIHKRDAFRHHSYTAPVCLGQICGLGLAGYRLALDALSEHIEINNH